MVGARVSIIGLVPQEMISEPFLLLLYHSENLAADCPFWDVPAIHRLFSFALSREGNRHL